MTNDRKGRLKGILTSTDGSVAVFVGLFAISLLAVGGMVVDYTRASSLHAKIAQATDMAVGEGVRGKTDAQVIQLAKASIDDFMKSQGYSGADEVTFSVAREGDVAIMTASTTYKPLFGPLYSLTGQSTEMAVSTSSAARGFCKGVQTEERWSARSAACPSGQIGTSTWEEQERRSATCASPTSAPAWGNWSSTGTKRNEENTCVALCAAPAAETQWTNRSAACPAGQVGSNTWQAEQRRTGYCPAQTGAPAWNPWSDTGATRNQVNTCAAPCVVPAPQTQWVDRSAACASTHLGTNTWQAEQRRTATCPAATGSPVWSAWTDTGTTRNVSNTCTIRCVAEASQYQDVPQTGTCPSGQSGTNSWVKQQRRDSSCPAATGSPVWGAWYDTGSTHSQVNTCAPQGGNWAFLRRDGNFAYEYCIMWDSLVPSARLGKTGQGTCWDIPGFTYQGLGYTQGACTTRGQTCTSVYSHSPVGTFSQIYPCANAQYAAVSILSCQ